MQALALRQQSKNAFRMLQRVAYSSGRVKELHDEDEFKQAISKGSVVLDFTAAWCPPCKMMAPVIEDLAGKHPDVTFAKVDIDNLKMSKVVLDHNIASVPTFVSYKGAQMLSSFSGADRLQLQQMIDEL